MEVVGGVPGEAPVWITSRSIACIRGGKAQCLIAACFLSVSQVAGQPCLIRSDAGWHIVVKHWPPHWQRRHRALTWSYSVHEMSYVALLFYIVTKGFMFLSNTKYKILIGQLFESVVLDALCKSLYARFTYSRLPLKQQTCIFEEVNHANAIPAWMFASWSHLNPPCKSL